MKRDLLKAVKDNDLTLVESLLIMGEDPYMLQSESVRIAIRGNNIEMIKVFLKRGFSPNANGAAGFTEAIRQNNLTILELLIEYELPSPVVITLGKQAQQSIKDLLNKTLKNRLI